MCGRVAFFLAVAPLAASVQQSAVNGSIRLTKNMENASTHPEGSPADAGRWVHLSSPGTTPPVGVQRNMSQQKASQDNLLRTSGQQPSSGAAATTPSSATTPKKASQDNLRWQNVSSGTAATAPHNATTSKAAPAGTPSKQLAKGLQAPGHPEAQDQKALSAAHNESLAHVASKATVLPHSQVTESTKCFADSPGEQVHHITDSEGNGRCFKVMLPSDQTEPIPVLFWFHASGNNSKGCHVAADDGFLADVAFRNRVGIVCTEARQDIYGQGGQWAIPTRQTSATGTRCSDEDSVEVSYVRNVMAELGKSYTNVDVSSVFFAGLSMGGAVSEYLAFCMHNELGSERVFSFMSHSTGLKVKGDNLPFPKDIWIPDHNWGECDECEYFPFVPAATNGPLKACLFDNADDPTIEDPFFFRSTENLATKWQELGNKAEVHSGTGGHLAIHSFQQILACLDDGTGKLVKKAPGEIVKNAPGEIQSLQLDESSSRLRRAMHTSVVVVAAAALAAVAL